MIGLGWTLFLCASVGHGALSTYVLNWIHGVPVPHKPQGMLKWIVVVLMPVATAFFWWLSSFPVEVLVGSSPAGPGLTAYAAVCVFTGVALPFIVLGQVLMHKSPPALVSNHSRTVDVPAELGYRPEGHGKYRLLTRLPGNEALLVELSEKTLS